MATTFTVFYDGQFWVGVLESTDESGVRAVRHVFGAEPSNAQLGLFALREFDRMLDRLDGAVAVPAAERPSGRMNPKRAARLAQRARTDTIGTASELALKETVSRSKAQAMARAKVDAALQREERRRLAAAQRRARHRGR